MSFLRFMMTGVTLLQLTACADTPLGQNLEKALAVDPTLTEASPPDSPPPTVEAPETVPNPTPGVREPVGPVDRRSHQDSQGKTAQVFSDLGEVPPQLRSYVEDVAALGVLTPVPSPGKTPGFVAEPLLAPTMVIRRGEFAQWLVAANNQLFQNRPAQQIRLGDPTATPAFQDVTAQEPIFGAIQGLAEAGILPSGLMGNRPPERFRPWDPLTREDLVIWKVPLDLRRSLPVADGAALRQSWGFQDGDRISPQGQRALLGDFQNGDLANVRRVYGYTTLFQPQRAVTRGEAAAALWYFGSQGEGISAQSLREVAPNSPSRPLPQ